MKKTGIIRNCLQCNKPFYVQRNLIKKKKGIFCGQTCKYKNLSIRFKGNKSACFKGGIYKGKDGYVYLRKENHQRYKGVYIKRAILVAEQKIGRFLKPSEITHHINKIKDDDRPENILVTTRSNHNKIHKNFCKDKKLICTHRCFTCSKEFMAYPSEKRKFCSQSCSAKTLKNRLGTGKNAKI